MTPVVIAIWLIVTIGQLAYAAVRSITYFIGWAYTTVRHALTQGDEAHILNETHSRIELWLADQRRRKEDFIKLVTSPYLLWPLSSLFAAETAILLTHVALAERIKQDITLPGLLGELAERAGYSRTLTSIDVALPTHNFNLGFQWAVSLGLGLWLFSKIVHAFFQRNADAADRSWRVALMNTAAHLVVLSTLSFFGSYLTGEGGKFIAYVSDKLHGDAIAGWRNIFMVSTIAAMVIILLGQVAMYSETVILNTPFGQKTWESDQQEHQAKLKHFAKAATILIAANTATYLFIWLRR